MKTRLKIDLTIDENKIMSGEVMIRGDKVLAAAAILQVAKSNTDFKELIKAISEVNRMNNENTEQNR